MEKLELAKWASEYAIKKGADQSAVNVSNSRNVEISVRDGDIETLKETTENSLGLTIYLDHKYSGHFTNDLRKESVKKLIDEAVIATKYLSADKFRELADPKYYPTDTSMDLKLLDADYDKLSTDERIRIAREIESAAVGVSDKIISASGSFSDSLTESVKVLSNGFEGVTKKSFFSISAGVTVKDKNARPEDWAWSGNRFFNKLPTFSDIGTQAANRALRKIGQQKIESGQYDMLVENRTIGRLIGTLIGPMSARSLQQKNSFLEGMLDKTIASKKLTIIDNPFIEGATGSRLYDGDGIKAEKRIMIENGVLKNYYIDNYYGRKLGKTPTSSGTSNLIFDYGNLSLSEMIKSIDKGIFVTNFNGGNSNGTTGDFSYGIGGILIEKGVLTTPVYEMNITGNALEFWQKLAETANDAYTNSSWQPSSMLFEGIHFAGK